MAHPSPIAWRALHKACRLPYQRGSKPNSVKGMKSTIWPSLTSVTSSATSIRPSASRNEEINPDPSRANFSTASRPSLSVSLARQNSRRPCFFVCANAAAIG